MSTSTSQSPGEYWWAVKQAKAHKDEGQTEEPVVCKNFSSASFQPPKEYLVRNDPEVRKEYVKEVASIPSTTFLDDPNHQYALDQMFSSASFPAGPVFAAHSTLKYKDWNPKRFSGYSSK